MEGHSRAGLPSEGDADFFDRVRSDWGRDADMFFEQDPRAAAWGFPHGAHSMGPDPEMAEMRARSRPKFGTFDRMRPGVFGPRPFQRERAASGDVPQQPQPQQHQQPQQQQQQPAPQNTAAPPTPRAAQNGGERIIPIQIERDDTDGGRRVQQQPQQQQQQQGAGTSPRQQKRYVRRETVDTPAMRLLAEEAPRDVRAHSCPPPDAPQPGNTAAASPRVTPLNIQQAQQQQQQKPNYFNSSPKPFSPEARTFQQAPSFMKRAWPGDEATPIPVRVERGGPSKQGPPVAPKPQQQPNQQQHQQQQAPRQSPPRASPPKPKTPKERAMERIESVRAEVAQLSEQVDAFCGVKGEKQYLYLDEMLTRELIKLDDVETGGLDDVRAARKDTIMSIQKSLARLEERCAATTKEDSTEPTTESTTGAGEQVTAAASAEEADKASETVPESNGDAPVAKETGAAEAAPTKDTDSGATSEAPASAEATPPTADTTPPMPETVPAPSEAAPPASDTATEAATAPQPTTSELNASGPNTQSEPTHAGQPMDQS